MIDRRSFLTLGACPAAAALAQTPAQAPTAPAAASPFADPDFGFTAQIALGAAYYGGCDPGKLLAILSKMLRDGKQGPFDQMMKMGTQAPRIQGMLRMRMRPFGTASYYEVFRAVQEYKLAEVAGRITCPMLITDPEGEQFFPGQSQKLHDALRGPKKLIHFTREEGADQHCEVNAPGYRDYCIYNWLAETIG